MPELTNPKQELFAQHIAAGMTGKAAAIASGYAEKRATISGSELLARPNVKERVNELRAQMLGENHDNASYTLSMALKRASAAYDIARTKKNASAMVAAVTLEAKLAGILVEKRQDVRDLTELSEDELDRMLAGRAARVAIDQASAPAAPAVEPQDTIESDN